MQRLARALRPRALVPIHTFHAKRFPDLFDAVTVREDGVWYAAV